MQIPRDYAERVYAGVLGKMIGIYLGLPPEGKSYEQVMSEFGEIWYYVNGMLNWPLVGTSDDITYMHTFLRALPDYGNRRDLTPEQVGQTWLNYIIEERTALWWGGRGNAANHTAYLHLKSGIKAPRSGSIALNGKVLAQQIGGRIFVDSWAMVAPGDPELAAHFARTAFSVAYDGEGVYGGQMIAAMEAQAFVEADLDKLLDTGLRVISEDSVIYRETNDVREWHAGEKDWRRTRERIDTHYGYHRFAGGNPMVSNHALVILALLYGDDDFQKSLMVANTAGGDVDCNSSAVGCLLGIKNGLAALDSGPDWRGPVEDRLYLSTADGGRAITDAVTETYHIVNVGRALAGEQPVAPKGGARFHFELPGSVQCFRPEDSYECRGTLGIENVPGHSKRGQRSLALRYHHLATRRFARVATATFTPPEAIGAMTGPGYRPRRENGWKYNLMASPTLYPGQTVRVGLEADISNAEPVTCRLYIRVYGSEDQPVRTCRPETLPDRLDHRGPDVPDELTRAYGPEALMEPGAYHEFEWHIGDTGGAPIAEVGLEVSGARGAKGSLYLDYLTWDGEPDVVLGPTVDGRTMWRRAWVDGIDDWAPRWREPYQLAQNHGTGLLIQGTREWKDYRVSATITVRMAKRAGLAARVQGMRRYYALLLCDDGKVRLIKALDGDKVLAEQSLVWELEGTHEFSLQVVDSRLVASMNGRTFFDVEDTDCPLTGGGVALVVDEGNMAARNVRVQPAR